MIVGSQTSGHLIPSLLSLLSLSVLLVSGEPEEQQQLSNQQNVTQPTTSTTTTTANPYWRRPGCHRVGHTRTISIPGCVKFNLSTNACRGYCMSYSIPSTDDLNPLGFEEPQQALTMGRSINESQLDSELIKRLEVNTAASKEAQVAGRRSAVLTLPKQDVASGIKGVSNNDQLAGAIGEGQKRDVVSVSQCCNMMETEDVVVNLRCGSSEIRRLVFKSAKTCECFFCKHI